MSRVMLAITKRRSSVQQPVVRYYGKNAVSEFGTLSLKFIRDKMIENGLARKTINTRITVIPGGLLSLTHEKPLFFRFVVF